MDVAAVSGRAGPWRLVRLLGRGGMGEVHEAIDDRTGRRAAVKLLLRPDGGAAPWLDAARRLRDEARAAGHVDSPHVARLLDSGETPEAGPYLVYEYLSGGTLRRLLDERRPLPAADLLSKVARPLLLGLADLHRAKVVHRDVKPENLLFGADGALRLADLGLACFEGREARTATGVVVGTPGYLAPERLLTPDAEPTPAGDVYAAAVVVVEAATGRLPFDGTGPGALLRSQLDAEPTASSLEGLGLPRGAASALAAALRRAPAERTADAQRLLRDLESAFTPDATAHAEPSPTSRRLAPALLLAAGALLLGWRLAAAPDGGAARSAASPPALPRTDSPRDDLEAARLALRRGASAGEAAGFLAAEASALERLCPALADAAPASNAAAPSWEELLRESSFLLEVELSPDVPEPAERLAHRLRLRLLRAECLARLGDLASLGPLAEGLDLLLRDPLLPEAARLAAARSLRRVADEAALARGPRAAPRWSLAELPGRDSVAAFEARCRTVVQRARTEAAAGTLAWRASDTTTSPLFPGLKSLRAFAPASTERARDALAHRVTCRWLLDAVVATSAQTPEDRALMLDTDRSVLNLVYGFDSFEAGLRPADVTPALHGSESLARRGLEDLVALARADDDADARVPPRRHFLMSAATAWLRLAERHRPLLDLWDRHVAPLVAGRPIEACYYAALRSAAAGDLAAALGPSGQALRLALDAVGAPASAYDARWGALLHTFESRSRLLRRAGLRDVARAETAAVRERLLALGVTPAHPDFEFASLATLVALARAELELPTAGPSSPPDTAAWREVLEELAVVEKRGHPRSTAYVKRLRRGVHLGDDEP